MDDLTPRAASPRIRRGRLTEVIHLRIHRHKKESCRWRSTNAVRERDRIWPRSHLETRPRAYAVVENENQFARVYVGVDQKHIDGFRRIRQFRRKKAVCPRIRRRAPPPAYTRADCVYHVPAHVLCTPCSSNAIRLLGLYLRIRGQKYITESLYN